MRVEKETTCTIIDYSLNRVDGALIGVGKEQEDAIYDFIKKATVAKTKSEENIQILDRLINEAKDLL